MKTKRIIMIVAIIVIYFLVFKAWNLLVYTDTKGLVDFITEGIEGYKNPETIKIETRAVNNYVEFDKLRLENIFKNYEELEKTDNTIKYIIYKDNTVKKYVSISKTVPFTTIFIEGFKNYSEQEEGEEYEYTSLYEPQKTYEYLLDNGVTSEFKFFEFLVNNYDNESKIYSSNAKMKENHYIKTYIANILPNIEKLYNFDGQKGYMFELISGGFEVHTDQYVITTMGLSKEEVSDLVGTIVINEEK